MNKRIFIIMLLCFFLSAPLVGTAEAVPNINLEIEMGETPEDFVGTLQILLLLTVLTLAPAILVLTTAFTRIIIVLSFIRNALATQQVPPNQVLIGLALFLTLFIMMPTWTTINDSALQPYLAGELSQEDAWQATQVPLREFMLGHTRSKDLALFLQVAQHDDVESYEEISLAVIVPAFVISELKTAFQMGFMLFVPFLVIDMVVASTLMSMGMMMLPPVMIALPFKILLFILVDGWHLVIQSLLKSFGG